MDDKERAFRQRLLATFRGEADEHVRAMSSGLVELERATEPVQLVTLIETVFRGAHSLKGAARAVDSRDVEALCQGLEGMFAKLKARSGEWPVGWFDLLHQAVDALDGLLRGGAPRIALDTLLQRLDGAEAAVPVRPPPVDDAAASSPARVVEVGERPAAADHTVRVSAARLDGLLRQAEGLLGAKFTAEQRAAELRDIVDALALRARERGHGLAALRASKGVTDAVAAAAHPDEGPIAEPHHRAHDLLLREHGYLGTIETRLNALAVAVAHDSRALDAMVDGLLDELKRASMLPVSSILDVLPKLVRDLARSQEKDVDLVIRGADIELDRRLLEAVRDPLIHLVRNAVDHGIEPPEQRVKVGKPQRGSIRCTVRQRDGSRIEIAIADDGAGIDVAQVEAAARSIGLVPEAPGSGREVVRDPLSLVFRSGVTTRPVITDISGRGLGLAIVQEKVEALGGSVAVESQTGHGTTFRIVLPPTLATFRGVRVQIGNASFVLPTTHVEQALRWPAEAVVTVEGRDTVQWGGSTIALVHLADLLELPREVSVSRFAQLVVVASGDVRAALRVDEIVGEEEVLAKPLGRQLSRVRNIVGAAVLGTGRTVPILDVPDLLRSAMKLGGALAPIADPVPIATARRSILVAEDSITSRMLLKNILESAGYDVVTCVDGADAYATLQRGGFDLLVSDVEMPRMGGLELTARIRADRGLADLPVILVTTLGSPEDRDRGIEAGADAYLVKSRFEQSDLLEAVRRLL